MTTEDMIREIADRGLTFAVYRIDGQKQYRIDGQKQYRAMAGSGEQEDVYSTSDTLSGAVAKLHKKAMRIEP